MLSDLIDNAIIPNKIFDMMKLFLKITFLNYSDTIK